MKKLTFLIIVGLSFLLTGVAFALPGSEKKDCKVWDASTINTDTDWLSSDCQAGDFNESVRMSIQVSCPSATVVEIDINTTRSDTSATLQKTLQLNGGTALIADSGFNFSFLVPAGGSWNIQHKTTVQNCSLLTFESNDLNQ